MSEHSKITLGGRILEAGKWTVAVFFVIFIFAFFLTGLFDRDKTVSETENRILAPLPHFNMGLWLSGEFSKQYEIYVSDTFPYRDSFLSLNAKLNRYYSQLDAFEEGVWIEKRFLFKNRGMGHYVPADEDIAKYVSAINEVKEKLPDVNVYDLLVPASFNFYAPTRYQDPTTDAHKNIRRIFSEISDDVMKIDIYPALDFHKDEYIYFRTDYHWTARGAYYAFASFADRAGFSPAPLSRFERGAVEGDFFGALIREMHEPPELKNDPDFVEFFYPEVSYTATVYDDASMTDGKPCEIVSTSVDSQDKYLTFNEGDHPILHIVTGTKNGRSIMLIKDSFANPMAAFLMSSFEEIYYVDYRYIRMDMFKFIRDHDIQDLLFVNKITLESAVSEFVHMENRLPGENG